MEPEIVIQWIMKFSIAAISIVTVVLNVRILSTMFRATKVGLTILPQDRMIVLFYISASSVVSVVYLVLCFRLITVGPSMIGSVYDDLTRTATFLLMSTVLLDSVRKDQIWNKH